MTSPESHSDVDDLPSALADPSVNVRRGYISVVVLANVGIMLAFFTPIQALLPRLAEQVDPLAKESALAWIAGVGALVAIVANPVAGALSDRWPRSRVYAAGLACFAVGYIGLGLVDGGWVVFVLMAVYGGFNGFTDGVGKAWISGLVPPEVRGHAQGVFQGLSGGAVLAAGLWAGLLWESGPGNGVLPLLVSGVAAALACGWMLTYGRRLA